MTADQPVRPEPEGGDPACWLNQVCPECGHLTENAVTCPDCGTELPRDDD